MEIALNDLIDTIRTIEGVHCQEAFIHWVWKGTHAAVVIIILLIDWLLRYPSVSANCIDLVLDVVAFHHARLTILKWNLLRLPYITVLERIHILINIFTNDLDTLRDKVR